MRLKTALAAGSILLANWCSNNSLKPEDHSGTYNQFSDQNQIIENTQVQVEQIQNIHVLFDFINNGLKNRINLDMILRSMNIYQIKALFGEEIPTLLHTTNVPLSDNFYKLLFQWAEKKGYFYSEVLWFSKIAKSIKKTLNIFDLEYSQDVHIIPWLSSSRYKWLTNPFTGSIGLVENYKEFDVSNELMHAYLIKELQFTGDEDDMFSDFYISASLWIPVTIHKKIGHSIHQFLSDVSSLHSSDTYINEILTGSLSNNIFKFDVNWKLIYTQKKNTLNIQDYQYSEVFMMFQLSDIIQQLQLQPLFLEIYNGVSMPWGLNSQNREILVKTLIEKNELIYNKIQSKLDDKQRANIVAAYMKQGRYLFKWIESVAQANRN